MIPSARLAALLVLLAPAAAADINYVGSFAVDTGGARPAAEMSVDRKAIGRIIFDTGATETIISPETADRLRLRNDGAVPPPLDLMAPDGYVTKLKCAALDGVALPSLRAVVAPLPLPGFEAIVSPNAFKGKLITLDLGGGRVTVSKRKESNFRVGVESAYSAAPLRVPTIALVVAGRTFAAHLDTGSPVEIILPHALANGLDFVEPPQQIGEARSHFGVSPIYKARIKGVVKAGPLTLVDPEIRITDAVPEANVGLGLLNRLEVTLDPAAGRVWTRERAAG